MSENLFKTPDPKALQQEAQEQSLEEKVARIGGATDPEVSSTSTDEAGDINDDESTQAVDTVNDNFNNPEENHIDTRQSTMSSTVVRARTPG